MHRKQFDTRLCKSVQYVQGSSAITPMQKLCLLKLVRPDCLVPAIQQYVISSLGPHFAESGPVSLLSVKKDSNNTTPIIFILSPGAVTAAACSVPLSVLSEQDRNNVRPCLVQQGHATGRWQQCCLVAIA